MKVLVATFQTLEIDGDVDVACYIDIVPNQVVIDKIISHLGLNMIISTSFQSFLIGIVVPDPEMLPGFAAKLGIKGSYEDLCKNAVSGFMFLVGYS